jgi:hypothetical protein
MNQARILQMSHLVPMFHWVEEVTECLETILRYNLVLRQSMFEVFSGRQFIVLFRNDCKRESL